MNEGTVAAATVTPDATYGLLMSDGEIGRAIVEFDWSATPLGPISQWRDALRTAVNLAIGSDSPVSVWWGRDLCLVHNAAYERDMLRERGRSLGRNFAQIWPDVVDAVQPQFDAVWRSGQGLSWTNERIDMLRDGVMTETYWTYSFTPILGRDGQTLGMFNSAREVTDAVLQSRLDRLLVELDARLIAGSRPDQMIDDALAIIGDHLAAKRTGYGEIDLDQSTVAITRCWSPHHLPDIVGIYPLGTFGALTAGLADGKPVVIRDNQTDPRTSDAPTRARYAAIGLRSGIVVPILDRGRYVGGVFVQDDQPRAWTPHQVDLAVTASQRLWQALVRLQTEIALRESDQRYRLIFEQANDIIFTADIDQRITDCNAAGAAALGLPRDAILGRSIADFVAPTDFAQTTAMLRQKLDHGGNTRHEVGVIGHDGRAMRWENDSTLVIDRNGTPTGLLSISRDVTERRAFEARRELMMLELNHRVKNTLSLVQGIAHQSFRPGADPRAAQPAFLARLHSLAAAHDLLTREHWEGVTLAELVRAATASFEADRFAAAGSAIVLCPKSALAIAMALHELGTNAVKYGALSNADGQVAIAWSLAGDRLLFDWVEHGGPTVTVPDRRGFGTKMIERALANDLRATVTMDFANSGVTCRIDAPRGGNIV